MNNNITDQLRFIDREIVRAWPLVGRTLTAKEDVSQEVFRAGILHSSIRFPQDTQTSSGQESITQQKVYRNDVIYHVYLTPRIWKVVGTLMTRDRYVWTYEMQLELKVRYPSRFVLRYIVEQDLVEQAVAFIQRDFEEYLSRYEYTQTKSVQISPDRWNTRLRQYQGLEVIRYACRFWSDRKRTEIDELSQNTEIKRINMWANHDIQLLQERLQRVRESEKGEYDREEKEKEDAFRRQEEIKKQIHMLGKAFRKKAADELTAILGERIREVYDSKGSLEGVKDEYFMLQVTFDEAMSLNASDLTGGGEEEAVQDQFDWENDETTVDGSIDDESVEPFHSLQQGQQKEKE